jgi:hypothetical protein
MNMDLGSSGRRVTRTDVPFRLHEAGGTMRGVPCRP